MRPDSHTAVYGLIGHPVTHSLSPALHNAAFAATGLNAVYLVFEPKTLSGCIQGIKALGIRGVSVTIPYKTEVLPWLDDMDPLARRIGAVNTVVNENGRLTGYNTDAIGALKALEEKTDICGKRCIILGAGGAARAIAFILRERGGAVCVANRSCNRGEKLARALGCGFIPLDDLGAVKGDILVQTTPVGMYPHMDRCPIPEHLLSRGMVVMDIVYNPLETMLLKAAKRRHCVTISGMEMFIHQGAEQFRLWTGMAPPVEAMARAATQEASKKHEGG